MKTKKLAIGIIVVAGLGIATYYLNQTKPRPEPSSANASERNEQHSSFKTQELSAELSAAREAIASLQTQLAEANATVARLRANEPAPEPLVSSEPIDGIPVEEYRRMQTARRLAAIDPIYGIYFEDSNLTEGQISQLKELMVEGEDKQTDIAMAVREMAAKSGAPVSPEAVAELRRKVNAEQDAKLEAVLGKEEFLRFKEYSQTARLRQVTNDLASALYYSQEPLSREQAQEVHRILSVSENKQVRSLNAINWDATLESAESILSPGQIKALKNIQERLSADREWYQTLSRVRTNR